MTRHRHRIHGPMVPVTPFETGASAPELASGTGPVGVRTDRHSLTGGVADAVDAGTVRSYGTRVDEPGRVGREMELAPEAISRLTHTRRLET